MEFAERFFCRDSELVATLLGLHHKGLLGTDLNEVAIVQFDWRSAGISTMWTSVSLFANWQFTFLASDPAMVWAIHSCRT